MIQSRKSFGIAFILFLAALAAAAQAVPDAGAGKLLAVAGATDAAGGPADAIASFSAGGGSFCAAEAAPAGSQDFLVQLQLFRLDRVCQQCPLCCVLVPPTSPGS